MRKYTASPHPFALRFPERDCIEPDSYRLDVLVIGHGQRFFPYIVHALQKAGQDGIGGGRQPFELDHIKQYLQNRRVETVYRAGQLSSHDTESIDPLPAMPERIRLAIHSPLRIKQNNHNLNPYTFNFGAFFGNLLRRISMLTYFHTDTPLETNFAELTRAARQIAFTDQDLRWFDWTRYSSRQATEMNMGGVLGSVCLDMQGMEPFWPYLWLGQWTHVGKGTSMGMGHYSIETASLPDTE